MGAGTSRRGRPVLCHGHRVAAGVAGADDLHRWRQNVEWEREHGLGQYQQLDRRHSWSYRQGNHPSRAHTLSSNIWVDEEKRWVTADQFRSDAYRCRRSGFIRPCIRSRFCRHQRHSGLDQRSNDARRTQCFPHHELRRSVQVRKQHVRFTGFRGYFIRPQQHRRLRWRQSDDKCAGRHNGDQLWSSQDERQRHQVVGQRNRDYQW